MVSAASQRWMYLQGQCQPALTHSDPRTKNHRVLPNQQLPRPCRPRNKHRPRCELPRARRRLRHRLLPHLGPNPPSLPSTGMHGVFHDLRCCPRFSSRNSPTRAPSFLSCVEHFMHTDWVHEQGAEPLCSATIQFLSLHSPTPPPPDLLDSFQPSLRPQVLDVLAITVKSQLHRTDDDTVLLVRKTLKPHNTGTSCTPSTLPPSRTYVPVLMPPWVMHTSHATAPWHLEVSSTVSRLERALFLWIGMNSSARW